MYTMFHKKQPGPYSAYFDNHKLKLHENRSKHAWIIVHCDYEGNVVGFSVNLANMQSLQYVKWTSRNNNKYSNKNRTKPSKIIIYTKTVGYNAFCRMFYRDCSKWPPFVATQERRRQCHCLTALSITRCSRRSHSSMIRCCNSSTVWNI